MDAHAQDNLPAEDPYARPPDDWVALLETLPPCDKCGESHVHMPGATRCIDCLANSPGPERRRAMYRILHLGGYYCSSCYIRETPNLGHSCAHCLRMRLAAKLRRKMIARLAPARRKLGMVREVAESVGTADNAVVAVQDAMRALLTVCNVFKQLNQAYEILGELTEVDAARAGAIAPEFHDAVEMYHEVSRLAQDAFVSATAGWMDHENANQGYEEALLNIHSFVPQIPAQLPDQHALPPPDQHHNPQPGQYAIQQPGQHPGQHPIQQPSQHPGQYPIQQPGQHPGQHPIQQPSQHPGQYPIQQPGQHPGQHPIQQPGQHPGQHPIQQPGQLPGQYPIQQPGQYPGQHPIQQPSQHSGQYSIQQPGQHIIQQNLTVNQQDGQHYLPVKHPLVDQNNVVPLEVPDLPGEHHHPPNDDFFNDNNLPQPAAQQHQDHPIPQAFEGNFSLPVMPQQFDEIQHGRDDLLDDYNIPPLVAPQEDNDDDDPYPDDILLDIDRFGNQAYNPVPQTDN